MDTNWARWVVAGWASSALFLVACSDSVVSLEVDGPDAPVTVRSSVFAEALAQPLGEPVQCNLSLSTNRAMPGAPVQILGVPETFGPAAIRVIAQTPDGSLVDPLFVAVGAAPDSLQFVTPIHPSQDADGGFVALELGDGAQHCPPLDFEVLPLPDAPADYAESVRLQLEALVDDVIRSTGLDPDELLGAEPQDVLPGNSAFWLAKQFTSADREDSLLRVAAGAGADPDLLLERMLMGADLEAHLQNLADAYQMIPPAQREPATKKHRQRRPLGRAKRGACTNFEIDPQKLDISSPEALSQRMLAVAGGQSALSGRPNDGLALLGGYSMTELGNYQNNATFASTGLFVLKSLQEAEQALQPQTITDFDVRAETLWVEDRPQAQPLRWEGATIHAEGQRFNVSKATLEGLLGGLGLVGGGAAAFGTAATVAGLVDSQGVSAALDEVTGNSCFQIAPPRYGPIIANDEAWVTAIIEGAAVERVSHRQYRGVDQGSGVLKVTLNTEKFAADGFFEKQFTVVVEPLNLSVSRSQVFVSEPGEIVELSALVTNAFTEQDDFTSRLIGSSGDVGEIIAEQRSGGLYEIRVRSASDRESYPTFVEFEAQNLTLPLGAEKRRLRVKLDVDGSLDISPDTACLLPSQPLDVRAEIKGFLPDNQDVKWTTTGGSFTDPEALETVFTAPDALGEVVLTVTSLADSEVADSVTYTVSETCLRKAWYPSASISVSGNGVYSTNRDPSGSSPCPLDSHDDPQVEELQTPQYLLDTQPPDVPDTADLWFGRSDRFAQTLVNNSSHHQGSTDTVSCSSVTLDSSVDGSVLYASDADGALSMAIAAQMTQRCERHDDDSVVCADVQSIGSANGYYYLSLDKEQRYRLQGSLSCTALAGNITLFPFVGTVQRFVDGQDPYQPEPPVTGVRDAQGDYRSPQLFSVSCSDPNELTFIDQEFILDAPQAGDTDLVVISILGLVQAGTDAIAKEGFGPPDFSMPTFPPQPPPEPTVGTHSGAVDIEFEIDLEELP